MSEIPLSTKEAAASLRAGKYSAVELTMAVLARAVAENQTALEFGRQRFKVGSGDLRAVSQQQLAVFATNSALLRVQSERLVQRVNLYLALGGGFEAAPAAQPVAQAKE